LLIDDQRELRQMLNQVVKETEQSRSDRLDSESTR
jgi:hypothetical protein